MKRLFSYILISVIALGIFIAPIGTAHAVTALEIQPIQPADITPNSGTFKIKILGPKAGDAFDLNLLQYDEAGLVNSVKHTNFTSQVSDAGTEQTVSLLVEYNFQASKKYRILASTNPSNTISNAVNFNGDGSGSQQTDTGFQAAAEGTSMPSNIPSDGYSFECKLSIEGVKGCLAAIVYTIFWEPLAAFARLAAKILDFFVYYSTNSSSYSSEFIRKAWGAVRDIANIFFIVSLLYIAIQTILNLGHGAKKAISSIIIVALLINFSLFFTQVLIDGSNILAKVFYNNIKAVDSNGNPLPANSAGEKSISLGLTKPFNPQNVITQDNYAGNIGLFIFVTLLSSAIMAFMAYIFFSVAMLFVGRVVALWLSMIFAPIAFASKTLPHVHIPGFGWEEWLSNLLKNAFLAPVFIFFLYVIILFGDFFSLITYDIGNSTDYMDKFMKTIIPFAIIFILLTKAKEIAQKMSGEIGAAMSKIGSGVAGLAVGGALGAYALAGRSTIGRLGQMAADSGKLKDLSSNKYYGWAIRGLQGAGGALGAASFDVRGTGLVKGVGKPAQGGFAGMKERQEAKRLKRAKDLEVGDNEKEKQELNKLQTDLRALQMTTNTEVAKIDKQLEAARQNLKDANLMPNLTDEDKAKKRDALAVYGDQLKVFKKQKDALKTGQAFKDEYQDIDGNIITVDKNYSAKEYKSGDNTLKDMEESVHHAEHAIELKNYNRRDKEADRVGSGLHQTISVMTGGSASSDRNASHNIRMGMKPPKDGHGDHGGDDDHGDHGHAAPAEAHAPAPAGAHAPDH